MRTWRQLSRTSTQSGMMRWWPMPPAPTFSTSTTAQPPKCDVAATLIRCHAEWCTSICRPSLVLTVAKASFHLKPLVSSTSTWHLDVVAFTFPISLSDLQNQARWSKSYQQLAISCKRIERGTASVRTRLSSWPGSGQRRGSRPPSSAPSAARPRALGRLALARPCGHSACAPHRAGG